MSLVIYIKEATISKLTRWESFRELVSMRKEMDLLFDEVFTRPFSIPEGWGLPLEDLYQTDGEIVVKATIPGIESNDLDIQVTGDTLTIRVEVKQKEEAEAFCFGASAV